ncbi:MAG: hypothetical protein AB1705_23925, partial [Verrucomicrobiota bacterium]
RSESRALTGNANQRSLRVMSLRLIRANRRAPLLAALFAGLFATSCASHRPAPPHAAAPPENYMRLARPDNDTVELQIAVRRFVPARRSQPVVWLAGASHIGEPAYYQALQKHLDGQALVLFEGVAEERRHARATEPKRPASEDTSLQSNLARSLGLVFQLDAIDYEKPHFRNSDLTIRELQVLMEGEAAVQQSTGAATDGPPADNSFNQLVSVMDGSSFLGAVVQGVVKLIGSNPKLQALAKLAFIETLGQLEGDLARAQALPPDLKRLMEVLIHHRNDVVIRELREEMGKPKPPASISVFFGAAHMPDMERRLTQELNYRPADQIWVPAFSVSPAKAGLSPAEITMVHAVVKWQMQILNAQEGAGKTGLQ